MNLTWHIVKKDLRSVFWPLVLFALFIVAELACGAMLIWDRDSENSYWADQLRTYAWGALVVSLVVGWLLVPRLVQGDALHGTQAFWQTRPISARRLLAAKLLGLFVVFGAVPVLIQLPWWLVNGFGALDVLSAAIDSIAWNGAFFGLAMMVAVLSNSLKWYLGGTLALATFFFLTINNLSVDGSFGGREATRLFISLGLIGGFSATIIAMQFLVRSARNSLLLAGIGMLLVTATVNYWPWDWTSKEVAGVRSDAGDLTRNIELGYKGATASGNSNAAIRLQLDNVPAGYAVGIRARNEWHWNDGSQLVTPYGGGIVVISDDRASLGLPADEQAPKKREEYLRRGLYSPWAMGMISFSQFGLPSNPDLGPRDGKFALYSRVPQARVASEHPIYDLSAQLELLKPVPAGERPLRAGESLRGGGRVTRLYSVDVKDGVVFANVIESVRSPIWDDFMAYGVIYASQKIAYWFSGRLSNRPPPDESRASFWVTYKGAGLAMKGSSATRGPSSAGASRIAGVSIFRRYLGFASNGAGDLGGIARTDWEKTLSFVRMDYQALPFSRTVHVDSFDIGKLPAAGGRRSMRAAATGTATVTGEVTKPGTTVSLYEDFTPPVVQILRNAGGLLETADLRHVGVTRTDKAGATSRFEVDVEAYLDGTMMPEAMPNLEPGDVVDVPKKGR